MLKSDIVEFSSILSVIVDFGEKTKTKTKSKRIKTSSNNKQKPRSMWSICRCEMALIHFVATHMFDMSLHVTICKSCNHIIRSCFGQPCWRLIHTNLEMKFPSNSLCSPLQHNKIQPYQIWFFFLIVHYLSSFISTLFPHFLFR